MNKFWRFYIHLVNRRKEHIGDRSFMILLAIMVGVLAALVAMFLKTLIHFIEYDAVPILPSYFFFLFPIIGIMLVVFLKDKIFINAAEFSGIAGVLSAIRKKSSFIHYSLMYVQMITGAITIGLGGSSGLESPTVVTGSAIGSNVSRFFRLDYKFKTLFIGCGTAATIAAIFNAPIAGVIFATEVILPQFSATIFIPILISSATGAFFSELFVGEAVLFRVKGVTEFTLQEIPLILVLGLFGGLVSLYFTKAYQFIRALLQMISNKWKRALLGSLFLGFLIFIFPVLFGEGYVGVKQVISGHVNDILSHSALKSFSSETWSIMLLFGLILLIKPIATSLTINSGGEGGQFAPSLVTGGFAGYFFYIVATTILPHSDAINPVNYVLLGMGAVLAGVMHAPLTAMFLVAEITQSYELFIGLMLVTAMSFFIKIYFDRVPLYLSGSKNAAELETDKHEFISINNIRTADLVERDVILFYENDSLESFTKVFSGSDKKVFGVKNSDENVTGMITQHQIRKLISNQELVQKGKVKDIMTEPVATVDLREQMDLVVRKFDLYDVDYFPVMRKGKFIGFISRINVLASFREAMKSTGDILS